MQRHELPRQHNCTDPAHQQHQPHRRRRISHPANSHTAPTSPIVGRSHQATNAQANVAHITTSPNTTRIRPPTPDHPGSAARLLHAD